MKGKSSIPRWRKGLNSCFVIITLLIGMILPLQADAKQYEITGKVDRIIDGDTCLLTDNNGSKSVIRIWGIDAPEKRQLFGDRSTSFLSSLIMGNPVRILVKNKDKYGRLVGQVFHEGMDVGLAMVRLGFAWHYVSITKNKSLSMAQAEAKKQQLGLWSSPDPTPPWVFRIPKATGSAK